MTGGYELQDFGGMARTEGTSLTGAKLRHAQPREAFRDCTFCLKFFASSFDLLAIKSSCSEFSTFTQFKQSMANHVILNGCSLAAIEC